MWSLNYLALIANVYRLTLVFFARETECPFYVCLVGSCCFALFWGFFLFCLWFSLVWAGFFCVDLVNIGKGITRGHRRHYQFFIQVSVPPEENLPFNGRMV